MISTKNKVLEIESRRWCPVEHETVRHSSFCIYAQLPFSVLKNLTWTKHIILSIQRKCFETVTVFGFSQNCVAKRWRLASFTYIENSRTKTVRSMAVSSPTNDTVKVSSTLELNGFEKLFCLHGNWLTVCHVAHLSGDSVSTRSH